MTDREKLIKLMIEAKKADTKEIPFFEFLADFLIAYGVTVPKWIPVTELPAVGVKVLTLDKWGHVRDRELYQFSDGAMLFRPDGLLPGKDITHWRPMLQGPRKDE